MESTARAPDRSAPGAAFANLRSGFEEAAGGGQVPRTEHCEIGGCLVRFRIAGCSLAKTVIGPLRHLLCEAPDGIADLQLRVDLWDGAATGISCTGCRSRPEWTKSRPRAGSSPDGRFVSYQRADNLVVFDRADRRMIGWYADGAAPAFAERGRPLGAPLVLWCHDRGIEVVHAALVAVGDSGVLIGGAGGSGKSTCALCCAADGFRFLGDDYVGLRAAAGRRFLGYSMYGSAHAEPAHLARFPGLAEHGIPDTSGRETKRMVPLARVPHAAMGRETTIRAVVLPRVADRDRTIYAVIPRGTALLGLAPSSLFALPHVRRERIDILADLVETTPCYRLELGRDLAEIPLRIRDILAEIGAV